MAWANIREIGRRLDSHLEPILVATLAGYKITDCRFAVANLTARKSAPNPNAGSALLSQIRVAISGAEADSTARTWLAGSNPHLAEDTP